jgi:glucose/mannose-6-phosphate isomerase
MTERVTGFPAQLRDAWSLAAGGPDLLAGARPLRIYVCGMGGSAIGGDFLRAFAEREGRVPVEVVRGYDLPRAAGPDSFLFCVSYSGGTEETLAAWGEATRRGVPRAAVTSGGPLAELAAEGGAPCLLIPGGSPPRAALGWTAAPLFAACARAGLLPVGAGDVEDAAVACEEAIAQHGPDAAAGDPLRAWAESCAGGLAFLYAPASPFAPCALRWQNQINENAKALAHVALFPEQNHNEIVGWEARSEVARLARVAFLGGEEAHPRVRRRMEIVEEELRKAGVAAARFRPRGRGLLARLLSLAVMGDLASLHLAAARGVDPTPVASIDRLKARLGDLPLALREPGALE